VRSTLRVPPSCRGVQRGNSLIKGMHRRGWLPFRTCLLQMLLCPFVFSRTFAIFSFCPVLFPFLLPHDRFPRISGNLHHVSSQPSPPLPATGAARLGAPPPWLDHAGTCREDPGRFKFPQRPSRGGLHPLQHVHHLRANPSDFLLLPFASGGIWALAAAPHPPLHSPRVGVRPLHGDVRGSPPCITIFKHFYALVGSGRSRCAIGAYYFQLRHGMSSSYISAFSSTKWEDWRTDWVIAMTDANDRLELPIGGLLLDRNSWKA
jgi:hypothetical protein